MSVSIIGTEMAELWVNRSICKNKNLIFGRCCKVEVNCGDGSSFDFAQDEVIFIAFRIRHILP